MALIANEVGAGVVPATPLGRAFRDWHGRLNQTAAAACGAVVAVAAGLPTQLKPARGPTSGCADPAKGAKIWPLQRVARLAFVNAAPV